MAKKFLLIASFPESILTFRGALIEALQKQGLEVHIASPWMSSELKASFSSMDVVVHQVHMQRTGTSPVHDFKTIRCLYKVIKQVSPDYTLGYTIKPVIYGSIAAFFAGVTNRFSMITGLGYAFTGEAKGKRKLLQSLLQRLYKIALKSNHIVFFQNPDDQALFKELGLVGQSANTVVVNGSGIDTSAFTPIALPETPSFLLIARLLGDKGVREYAEAAIRLKDTYPNVECALVGWIDHNPDAIAQNELDQWIASGAIVYKGRMPDVKPAIAQSSVYVLPSYREGTPRTVLEAMAMGRAVITTDAPGCRETVKHGDNGLLVPVKDSESLYQAMLYMIENQQDVIRMGKASRYIAKEKYDVNKVNINMLNAMQLNSSVDSYDKV